MQRLSPRIRAAVAAAALLVLAPAAARAGGPAARRPNVVFLLVDDIGQGSLGAFGSDFHETPNLDRLAAAGMKLTQSYSACTVCSPTRAAILTGQYPARTHVTDWIPGHAHPKAKLAVPDWSMQIDHARTTLAEALREGGYRTGFFGKWHLLPVNRPDAMAEHMPEKHGFDVNIGGREWGQPKGRGKYFFPFDMPGLEEGEEGEYLTDRLTDEALRFIDGADGADGAGETPFLLYMSYYTVHTPIMAKEKDRERFAAKLAAAPKGAFKADDPAYAAMHKSLDDSVGRIVDKIRSSGRGDDTLIVFTGDNGGDRNVVCGGLRGFKGYAFEGGTRVPTIVVWPGVVAPGSVCETPIISMDWYPTILAAAGLPARPEEHRDGVDIGPLLRRNGAIARDTLYWHYPHYHRTRPYSAIRDKDWKLIELLEDGEILLFDLAADPREENDLAAARPERAAALLEKLRSWRRSVGAQSMAPNPDHVPEPAREKAKKSGRP